MREGKEKCIGEEGAKRGGRSLWTGLAAASLFGLWCLAAFLPRASDAPSGEAQILVFGDSVMGEIRDETAIPARLQELSGRMVFNAAFGGTCAARVEPDRRLDYTKDSLSLAGLAKSAEAGDFGVQQSIIMRENVTEYFAGTVDALEALDFEEVEIILLQQGINDYHAGIPLDSERDPYDERTFKGALRTAVRSLRRVNPGARIVIVTPAYTWYPDRGQTCEEADFGGGVLEAYVSAQLELGRELDVEVIDVYHGLFPHGRWEDWELYSRDGLHPNEAGRERLAQYLADYLEPSGGA